MGPARPDCVDHVLTPEACPDPQASEPSGFSRGNPVRPPQESGASPSTGRPASWFTGSESGRPHTIGVATASHCSAGRSASGSWFASGLRARWIFAVDGPRPPGPAVERDAFESTPGRTSAAPPPSRSLPGSAQLAGASANRINANAAIMAATTAAGARNPQCAGKGLSRTGTKKGPPRRDGPSLFRSGERPA